MPVSRPNFSPFPYDRLPRIGRRDAAIASAVARWIAARSIGARVERLVGAPVRVRGVRVVERGAHPDPHAAVAEVRIAGEPLVVAAASRPVRAIAQRLLGGPPELDAPRPATVVEHAIWALVLAAALADLGVAGEVWPLAGAAPGGALALELAVEVGAAPWTIAVLAAPDLVVRAPPPRPVPGWVFALPIVVARCALPAAAVRALAARDVVIVEPALALVVGDAVVGLTAAPGAVEATVATGYVRAEMALPDDAHLPLTVELGTTRLSLSRLAALAVGEVVTLGRPLGGPYEIRAAGRLIGHGELVDVDGELGVRIVSLTQE